jgi:hypothetical protein
VESTAAAVIDADADAADTDADADAACDEDRHRLTLPADMILCELVRLADPCDAATTLGALRRVCKAGRDYVDARVKAEQPHHDVLFLCSNIPMNKLGIFRSHEPCVLSRIDKRHTRQEPHGCVSVSRAAHALRGACDSPPSPHNPNNLGLNSFPLGVTELARARERLAALDQTLEARARFLRETHASRVVQAMWLHCYYTPSHPVCRRRLLRELSSFNTQLASSRKL